MVAGNEVVPFLGVVWFCHWRELPEAGMLGNRVIVV